MSRINWNYWLKHEGDEILTLLHKAEDAFVRMIRGIGIFMWRKIPELMRRLLQWVEKALHRLIRIAVRLARVAAVFAAWCLLVWAPCIFTVNLVTLTWAGLAIAGSIYGLRLEFKKHSATANALKGVSHA